MGATLTTGDELLEPTSTQLDAARSERFDVRLRFGSAADASRYLRSLTSLLFGANTKVTATLTTGVPRGDLTAEEIAERLARNTIADGRDYGDDRPSGRSVPERQ